MSKRKSSPLNAKKSRANRDAALDAVEEGTSDEWQRLAYKTARRVAEECRFFTTDDVWRAGLPKPREPRALGPVMMSLQRDGIIAPTMGFKQTAQASRNAAPVRIWRSLLLLRVTA